MYRDVWLLWCDLELVSCSQPALFLFLFVRTEKDLVTWSVVCAVTRLGVECDNYFSFDHVFVTIVIWRGKLCYQW